MDVSSNQFAPHPRASSTLPLFWEPRGMFGHGEKADKLGRVGTEARGPDIFPFFGGLNITFLARGECPLVMF